MFLKLWIAESTACSTVFSILAGMPQTLLLLLAAFTFFQSSLRAQIVINEACIYNGNGLKDENGEVESWIELYNDGAADVSLEGFTLTDDPIFPAKWKFPTVSIPTNSHLIVFLSGNDRSSPQLHTGFEVSRKGASLHLFDEDRVEVSSMNVPALQLDHSFGSVADGSSAQIIFASPSPGLSNNLSIGAADYTPDAEFSHDAGFFESAIQLSLTCTDPSASIRYTLDGTAPSLTSSLYTGPLDVPATAVVKARAYSPGKLPSNIETNSYFIKAFTELPVFSISTDPLNLFHPDTGIYEKGPNASPLYPYEGANFWQDWERPVHLEFFEEDRTEILEQDMGVKIHGNTARTWPMKPLRLVPRKRYGDSDIDHRFFAEKDIKSFRSLVLRNASSDFSKIHFRDAFVHKLVLQNDIDLDVLAYRPSTVYINGAYWGIHNIRERISRHYVKENHSIDSDSLDILEEDTLVVEGSWTAFDAMHDFITSNDMSLRQNFESAAQLIDIESLADYYITETFFTNTDWPYNNMKLWRERRPGAKWRYVLFDLDIALNNNGWAPYSFDVLGRILGDYGDNCKHIRVFRSLLANDDFRNYFINRYADLVNTAYSKSSLLAHMERMRNAIDQDMHYHMPRWWKTYDDWTREINEVAMPYIENRSRWALDFVQDTFDLNGQVQLTLQVWPPGAGTIKLNTITPSLPFTGTYFDGVPVNATVVEKPGYKFEYWKSVEMLSEESYSSTVTFNPSWSGTLTAYFSQPGEGMNISVFPNPSRETCAVSFILGSSSEGTVEISDMHGKIVYVRGPQEFIKGLNVVSIPSENFNKGIYLVRISTALSTACVKLVKQ